MTDVAVDSGDGALAAQGWISVLDLATMIAATLAAAHARGWRAFEGNNEQRRDHASIATVENITDHICELARQQQFKSKNANGPDGQLLRADIEAIQESLIPTFERQGQHDAQEEWKNGEGRLTLREAARALSDQTGERYELTLRKIFAAAQSCRLAVFEPGKKFKYDAESNVTPLEFFEETYGRDLNRWLDQDEPQIEYRFPLRANDFSRGAIASEAIKKRGTVLDEVLARAIQRANSHDVASVYPHLRALAVEKHYPFSGVVEGETLVYTDANHKTRQLTYDALRKRLDRRR